MSLFFSPPANTNASLAKKFKVGSQTQLKKISNTYWRNQIPQKGIKMKGEEGGLVYVKHPGVRNKVSQLLKKRGYINETTLNKDLIKEKVRVDDRKKVIGALRGKFAKKEGAALTSEQILANVKRGRAVSRLMSTKGMSKAQEIEKGRHTEKIKEKFKEETYARLNVHGETHAISALGGQQVNPDDVRYDNKNVKTKNEAPVTALSQGPIKGVTSGNNGVSVGKDKENPLAAGIGTKNDFKNKQKTEISSQKKDGGGVGSGFVPLSSVKKREQEKKNNLDEISKDYYGNISRPAAESEWQGGVVFGGKKMLHLSGINANTEDVTRDKEQKINSDNSAKLFDKAIEREDVLGAIYIGSDVEFWEKCRKELIKNGFTSYNAFSGAKAIDSIKILKPKVVFLDMSLSSIGGFIVLKDIRADKINNIASTPVVALFNLKQKELVGEMVQYAHSDYLIKEQFNGDEMISKINNILK